MQIEELMTCLKPDAARIDLQTSNYERLRDELLALPGASLGTEPWFNVPFVKAPVPERFMALWRSASCANEPQLRLAPRNDFIATDFTLLCDAAGLQVCCELDRNLVLHDLMSLVCDTFRFPASEHHIRKLNHVPRSVGIRVQSGALHMRVVSVSTCIGASGCGVEAFAFKLVARLASISATYLNGWPLKQSPSLLLSFARFKM